MVLCYLFFILAQFNFNLPSVASSSSWDASSSGLTVYQCRPSSCFSHCFLCSAFIVKGAASTWPTLAVRMVAMLMDHSFPCIRLSDSPSRCAARSELSGKEVLGANHSGCRYGCCRIDGFALSRINRQHLCILKPSSPLGYPSALAHANVDRVSFWLLVLLIQVHPQALSTIPRQWTDKALGYHLFKLPIGALF
jgi:hypothetical protein